MKESELQAFIIYCRQNPNLRFFQAVRNFSKYPFIYGSNKPVEADGLKDTYYD